MDKRSLAAGLIWFVFVVTSCGGGSDSESAQDAPDETSASATSVVATVTPASSSTSAAPAPSLDGLLPAFTTLGPLPATEIDPIPIEPMCPGWDQFDGLTPSEMVIRTFLGNAVSGPFLTVGLLDFPQNEAEAFLDGYVAGSAGPCAEYETVGATGNKLSLGWSAVDGIDHGDRTVTMAVRGDSDGVPLNSDVALIRVGDRVGYVGYLVVGALPDAGTFDAAVSAVVASLDGENVGVVEIDNSAMAIAAALPGLAELANAELLDEAVDAAIPNGQCPSNGSTLSGLSVVGAGARRFLADQDFGPHVTVSILEFAPGEADVFIDRWAAGAGPGGPCASYLSNGLEYGWTVGSGPEYLDRTVTLFGRGRQVALNEPASADYVLVRSGDFVGYLHYFLVGADVPNVTNRDTMAAALVAALEQVSVG